MLTRLFCEEKKKSLSTIFRIHSALLSPNLVIHKFHDTVYLEHRYSHTSTEC